MKKICFIAAALFWPAFVWGAVIQYRLSTGEVTGIVDGLLEDVSGHGRLAIPGNSGSFVWPLPPGCAEGRREWTLVNPSVNPPVFMVNPALKFFRCQSVSSAVDVDRIAEEEVAKLSGPRAQQQMKQMRQAIKLLDVLSVECPPGSTTLGCDTKRTKALDTRTQMLSLDSQIEQIYSDATAFKTAQGW